MFSAIHASLHTMVEKFFTLMKKFLLVMLLFYAFQLQEAESYAQDADTWFNIDCGIELPRLGYFWWKMDDAFTQAGINKRLLKNQPLDEMTTLRFFPNRMDQNCYTMPTYNETTQYIIRAGFFYGNYDDLSKPPMFDLYLDGQKWVTINTSLLNEPIYVEAVYVTSGSDSFSLCLVQTKDGEIPFISSLEMTPLFTHLYTKMESNYTFSLLTRTNLGGNEIRYMGALSLEKYNRIWINGSTLPNTKIVNTLPDSPIAMLENDPPTSALIDSIESNTSDPIILTIDYPNKASQTVYVVLYFTEKLFRPAINDTRIINIEINGQMLYTIDVEIGHCEVVTLYPVHITGTTINITLAQSDLSSLPPIISAMEVFERVDSNSASETNIAHGTSKYLSILLVILVHLVCLIALL